MKKYIFLGLTIIVFFNFIPTLYTQEISQPQEIPEDTFSTSINMPFWTSS